MHTNRLIATLSLLLGNICMLILPNPFIGIGIIIVTWCWGRSKWGSVLPPVPQAWPIYIIAILSLLSALFVTADPDLTYPMVGWLWQGLTIFFIPIIWANTKHIHHIFALGLHTLGISLALIAPFIVSWGRTKITFIPTSIYSYFPSLVADVVHPNSMATILLLIMPIPLAWALLHIGQRPWHFWVASISLLPMVLIFILTQSRAGYLALILATAYLLWRINWQRLSLLLAGMTLALGVLAWQFPTDSAAQSSDLIKTATNSNTLVFRFTAWQQAILIMRDFSFTGSGMGTFNTVAERLYPYPIVDDPGAHNLYLHIGAESGLPVLIAYLSVIGMTFSLANKTLKKQIENPLIYPLVMGLQCGLLSLHLHGLLDNTLWGTRIAFLPWAVLGLITSIWIGTNRVVAEGHSKHSSVAS